MFVIVVAFVFIFEGFCVSAEENVLVIGDFQPLSGPGAALGLGNHRGVELAIDKLNEADGITVLEWSNCQESPEIAAMKSSPSLMPLAIISS